MIKTSKKIIAMFIAVLFVVAMVPFSAGAATEDVSFKVNCDKEGYKFEVYQLAALDTETGLYTKNASTSDAIFSVINDDTKTSADILAACDAAATGYGTKTGDTYVSKSGEKEYTVTSGIYYIKSTEQPPTVKSVTNSIVALPYYADGAWQKTLPETINLAAKVSDGDVNVDKKIVNSTTGSDTYTTAGYGDEVQFKLTATVVGSAEKKLKSFAITDNMDAGLTFKSIDSVTLKAATGGTDKVLNSSDYVKTDSFTYTPTGAAAPKTAGFAVELDKANVLDNADFYNYTSVEVVYTATLNENATKGAASNNNSDSLVYTNANDVVTEVDGTTVKVYTFGIKVVKVDSTDNNTKLNGAVFAVYDKTDAAKTVLATATTGTDGVGVFKDAAGKEYNFDKGTYVIYETKAPAGYNLNSAEIEVTINPTFTSGTLVTPVDGFASQTVENTPSKLPETGGMGTMAFTIIGSALIVCAGVLFVVIKRKKTAK